jgi:hypothetical protein
MQWLFFAVFLLFAQGLLAESLFPTSGKANISRPMSLLEEEPAK